QNFANGHGSTFDGIHLTNGYQPLWQWVLVPIFTLFPNGGEAPLRLIVVLQALLSAVGTVWLYKLQRLYAKPFLAILLSLVWIAWASRRFVTGMESSLYMLALIGMLWYWAKHIDSRPSCSLKQLATLSWFLTMTLLGRLDSGFIVALIVLRVLFQAYQAKTLLDRSRLFALLALPVSTMVAYLLMNQFIFDSWLPISGLTKLTIVARSSWPQLMKNVVLRSAMLRGFTLVPAWIGGIWVLGVYLKKHKLSAQQKSSAYFIFAAFLHYLFLLFALRSRATAPWYFMPQMLASSLVIGWFFQWLFQLGAKFQLGRAVSFALVILTMVSNWGVSNFSGIKIAALAVGGMIWWFSRDVKQSRLYRMAVVVLLLPGISIYNLSQLMKSASDNNMHHFSSAQYEAALWLRENTDEDTRIGAWNAGALGYFSQRQVINLDGLANSADYLDVMLGGQLSGYLMQQNVQYLSDVLPPHHPRLKSITNMLKLVDMPESLSQIVFADQNTGVERALYIYRVQGNTVSASD
ncbi:MAG: hypothetical protein KAG66_21710, partial [Methylococcales bacterium]|nr:hypothetical protein [Methylococcales bacterium]